MKKYIVLSVNDNPDYLYYTPLTCWAWEQFGWSPILMITSPAEFLKSDLFKLVVGSKGWFHGIHIRPIDGYRSDTVSQVSRLYAHQSFAGLTDPEYNVPWSASSYLMTGDIDMLPLSDYWKPSGVEGDDEHVAISIWGHDLTGYGHYPICYIGMSGTYWGSVMQTNSFRDDDPISKEIVGGNYREAIKRDLDSMPQAKNPDFYKYWFTDQDLVTDRINKYPLRDRVTFINRGQYSNGYAVGRVDRGAWSLNHSQFIDCHMFQQLYHKNNQDKFDKTMELLTSIWPDEDFGWFLKYTDEFRRLTGHA